MGWLIHCPSNYDQDVQRVKKKKKKDYWAGMSQMSLEYVSPYHPRPPLTHNKTTTIWLLTCCLLLTTLQLTIFFLVSRSSSALCGHHDATPVDFYFVLTSSAPRSPTRPGCFRRSRGRWVSLKQNNLMLLLLKIDFIHPPKTFRSTTSSFFVLWLTRSPQTCSSRPVVVNTIGSRSSSRRVEWVSSLDRAPGGPFDAALVWVRVRVSCSEFFRGNLFFCACMKVVYVWRHHHLSATTGYIYMSPQD